MKKQKKTPPPVLAQCRNCGTKLISRYCHNCGQDMFAGTEKSVIQAVSQVMDNLFAWDNKIFKSLKTLVLHPGHLTKEYLTGKIVPYVNPYKMFWCISLILFALLSFRLNNINGSDFMGNPDVSLELSAGEALEDGKAEEAFFTFLKDFLGKYLPYITFLLFPFFALLMRLFFRKKMPFYTQNLIFSVHFHTFLYIYFILLFFFANYAPESWHISIVYWIWLLTPFVYLFRAVYVAYRPRLRSYFLKLPFILFIYFITSVIIVGIIFVLLMFYFKIVD